MIISLNKQISIDLKVFAKNFQESFSMFAKNFHELISTMNIFDKITSICVESTKVFDEKVTTIVTTKTITYAFMIFSNLFFCERKSIVSLSTRERCSFH